MSIAELRSRLDAAKAAVRDEQRMPKADYLRAVKNARDAYAALCAAERKAGV